MRGRTWTVVAVLAAVVWAFSALDGSGNGWSGLPPLLPLLVVLIIALPVMSFQAWDDHSRLAR